MSRALPSTLNLPKLSPIFLEYEKWYRIITPSCFSKSDLRTLFELGILASKLPTKPTSIDLIRQGVVWQKLLDAPCVEGRQYLKSSHTTTLLNFVEKDILTENEISTTKGFEKSQTFEEIIDHVDHLENEMMPTNQYTFHNLVRNMETISRINKPINIRHIFNDMLPIIERTQATNGCIQRYYIKIKTKIQDGEFPLTYEMACPYCENTIEITYMEMSNPIGCRYNDYREQRHIPRGFTAANEHNVGHKLTPTISTCTPKKRKMIHLYEGEFGRLDGTFEQTMTQFFCFEELEPGVYDANIITGKEMGQYIILSVNPASHLADLPNHIVQITSKNRCFLDELYDQLVNYLSVQHGMNINTKGKIIAETLILQLLMNLLHKERTYFLLLGTSGAGKTFWGDLIPQLLTFSYEKVSGEKTTKNIVLGGRSARKDFNNQILQSKGVICSRDFVLFEESGNCIDDFLNKNKAKQDNLFSMLKSTNDRTIGTTTQGTQENVATASIVLTGNLEQLQSTEQYLMLVRERYKMMNRGISYLNKWPLFKPYDFYKQKQNDEKLSQAHYDIRTSSIMHEKHYITRLNSAEMARFPFFIVLEDDVLNKNSRHAPLSESTGDFDRSRFHTGQIRRDLKNIFTLHHTSMSLRENKNAIKNILPQVENYIRYEFHKKRHNFFNLANGHMTQKILKIALSFFVFQKQWQGEDILTCQITDREKEFFEFFMSFHYNVISIEESRMLTRPFINDDSDYDPDIEANKIVDQKIQAKIEAQTQSELTANTFSDQPLQSQQKSSGDLGDIFRNIGDLQ